MSATTAQQHSPECPQQLDRIFHALSDATRRGILQRIASQPLSVGAIAEPLPMSLAAVSKHIKVLERAELVQRVQRGRNHHVLFNAEGFASAGQWLAHYQAFWGGRLHTLQQFLEENPP